MRAGRTAVDWLLEALALVGLTLAIAFVAMHWGQMPARIPTHFNASGEADAWGGKGSLLFLLAVHAGVYAVLTAASFFPHMINVPFQIDRQSPAVQAIALHMSITLKAVIMALFAWMSWQIVQTALSQAHGLGRAFLPVFLGGVLLPSLYFTVQLWKHRVR